MSGCVRECAWLGVLVVLAWVSVVLPDLHPDPVHESAGMGGGSFGLNLSRGSP